MSRSVPDITHDALLLKQLHEGSEQAFNTLFEKYWDKSFSEAYKRIKDYDAAKDIVQDIFSQIWINRGSVLIENFSAYLHTAIRNQVIRYAVRQKQQQPFFQALELLPGKYADADAPLLWKEFLQAYEALIDAMPPKRQQIFRLRFQQGLATRVISLQMGIKRKTVQNQLGKAIEALKVSLLQILGILLLLLLSIA
ncbi:MAG: sigma-70 family RNA polymerase sigma factor [Candidatus Pseudobacter hemicellulosilyticus]|uniref:Sigma-70 family RNA polymerase sigma factor n=1 Tax=Candidatus Pseudobacter hemicellulosilyticus TaxID=3121375 RepID=A0AAJ6BF84_9BACT|nr:MAG: sigma-70 family RNA polymerase sigma factor [Pseudobacter sp.]